MIVWTKILDQVSKIQIKSITDSLFRYGLWLFITGAATAIFKADTWVIVLIFSVGGLFFLIGLIFYVYYSIKNPDYLRSENFQIQKQSIEMLGDKDNCENPNIKSIVLIANPFVKGLEDDKQNEFGK
jgi:hypothetical protein